MELLIIFLEMDGALKALAIMIFVLINYWGIFVLIVQPIVQLSEP